MKQPIQIEKPLQYLRPFLVKEIKAQIAEKRTETTNNFVNSQSPQLEEEYLQK